MPGNVRARGVSGISGFLLCYGHRDAVLRDIEVIEVDAGIATAAAAIGPPTLRTLDAIHLASALSILPELDAFVTYDDRLAEAARAIGLPVMRPA